MIGLGVPRLSLLSAGLRSTCMHLAYDQVRRRSLASERQDARRSEESVSKEDVLPVELRQCFRVRAFLRLGLEEWGQFLAHVGDRVDTSRQRADRFSIFVLPLEARAAFINYLPQVLGDQPEES